MKKINYSIGDTAKMTGATRKQIRNPIRLLPGSDRGNSPATGQKHRYNTHIEISCQQHVLTAASYIIVLSIIPPFKISS